MKTTQGILALLLHSIYCSNVLLIHVIIIIAVEYCLNLFDFIDDFSPRVSSVEISYSDIGFSALGMPGRTLVDFSLLLSQIGKSNI